MHGANEFVTLTYDDAHLPARGSLDYTHFQDFIRSLRKASGVRSIRYLGAGEYGSQFMRPHFHALLFGLQLHDRKLYKTASSGGKVYDSPSLQKHWPHGAARTGDVTLQSCAYVARYITEKKSGDSSRYIRVDPKTGEVYRLEPEFNFMSLKPGIGAKWFEKYKADAWPRDYVVIDGVKRPLPKYYERLLGESREAQLILAEVQTLRLDRLAEYDREHNPTLDMREACALARLSQLKRNKEFNP